jgi:thioredoxin-like negative regulator of GroEL
MCRQYKVTRLPVVMLFNEGRMKDVIGGVASADTVNEMVERQLRPVLDVGEHNFDVGVLKSPVPVLVHVDAAWCADSRELVPVVEAAAEKYRRRAKAVRLEYGPENARLCAQYGFMRVPMLAVFVRGQIEDRILGAMTGGTKTDARATSCVGLSSTDNVGQMLEQFVLSPWTERRPTTSHPSAQW